MAMPVVTVATGGLPVVDITATGGGFAGTAVTEALNGRGTAVTKVTTFGLPVVYTTLEMGSSGVVISGLVGQWTFTGGSLTDVSGNGNTGTAFGSPTFVSTAKGGAVSLIGSATNQCIIVGSSASINTSPLTYAAWINCTNPALPFDGNGQAIIGARTAPSGPCFRVNTNAKINFLKAGAVDMGQSTGTIPAGVLTHVAVTYNNPNLAFYINGAPSGTGSSAQTFTFSDLAIGVANGGTLDPFTGTIGDVRIYNRALSAAEVLSIFQGA